MADAQKDDPDLMDPDSYDKREDMEKIQRDMDKADRGDGAAEDNS